MTSIVKNDLFDYPNRYIMQMENGFKFSLDSILLAEYATLKSNDKVLDMCTGNAPIPLILSTKVAANYVGFEIQKDIAKLAIDSVKINKLENIKIINDDIKNIEKYYNRDFFDIIVCNPPFFNTKLDGQINKNEYLQIARHEIMIALEDIFAIASKYLKPKGTFYMVHRSNRLDDLFFYSRKYNLNIKEMQLINTKEESDPQIVLIKCVKMSKSGVKVKKEICVDKLETYQHLFKKR